MDPLAYLIIISLAAIGGLVGYFAIRRLPKVVTVVIWLAYFIFTFVMAERSANTPGWDAIGYAVVLFGGCIPAGIGLMIGGLIGRFKNKPSAEA